jgi:antitoxin component of MazEF toxin-antitoxin module
MKLTLRRIGNSLGVIIPKTALDSWGLIEGDYLTLTEQGLRPARRSGFLQSELDELNRSISMAIVDRFTPRQIRAQILANLHRWKNQGVWVTAYDEWRVIAESEDDGRLYAAMVGQDQESIRLRQSMPYVDLLPQKEVRALHEQAA